MGSGMDVHRHSRRHYLWLTVLLSVLALALEAVAVAVNYWTQGEIRNDAGSTISYNYGLYSGSESSASGDSDLSIVCYPTDNLCMMSTHATDDTRLNDLKNLVSEDRYRAEDYMIIASTWYAILVFLAIGGISGAISAFVGIINALCKPVARFTGAFGLYIYNGCAGISLLLVMSIWGSQTYKVPLYDFITENDYDDASTYIGYAYWLLLPAMCFYFVNGLFIYYYRNYFFL